MYQSFNNLLLEAGYQKCMSQLGPVYAWEKGEDRQLIYLTYHRDQAGKLISAKDYTEKLVLTKQQIFHEKETNLLCILIVDDGQLSKNQCEEQEGISVWIQDENTGRLYMNKGSESKFKYLYEYLQKRGEEARKKLEQLEQEEKEAEVPIANEWKRFLTPVNTAIIAINCICYTGIYFYRDQILAAGVSVWDKIMIDQEYYRLFTSIFLHFDLQHLAENMVLLFFIGSFVEREWGQLQYLMTYIFTGLIGNIVSFYMQIGNPEPVWSAGASGAIYGILGVLAVLLLQKHKRQRMGVYEYPGIIIIVIAGIFHSYHESGIDNYAHLGGLIAGLIFGIYQMLSASKQVENEG